jgi:hypothetical protein
MRILMTVVIAAAAALPLSIASGQNRFPEAPGRDALFLACSQCHSVGKVMLPRLNREEWQFIVYDMISRGAPVHAEDVDALTKYLQDNFARETEDEPASGR